VSWHKLLTVTSGAQERKTHALRVFRCSVDTGEDVYVNLELEAKRLLMKH
jgi:hypothetical protein